MNGQTLTQSTLENFNKMHKRTSSLNQRKNADPETEVLIDKDDFENN